MRAWTTVVVAATLALLASAAGATSGVAADQARVRIAYLAPDASSADVYVDGVRTLSQVTYKTVSTYNTVTVGSHTIDVRAAGSDPHSSPWAEVSQTFSGSAYYTVVVGGRFGQLRGAAFQDAFSAPGAGQVEARFVHMAPDVPAVDVALKAGAVIFSNISFLQASSYKSLPAGSYDLELRAAGTDNVLFSAAGVVATTGTIHSLTGIGGVGQPIELLPLLDASAAASAQGGANTGGGGMAQARVGPAGPGLIATALLLLTLLPARARIRRARRRAT